MDSHNAHACSFVPTIYCDSIKIYLLVDTHAARYKRDNKFILKHFICGRSSSYRCPALESQAQQFSADKQLQFTAVFL